MEGATAARERVLPRGGSLGGVLARLASIADSAWFAYPSILAIQAKLLWGIWDYRDLTNGDTASYYQMAALWSDHLQLIRAWSPLYDMFYGSLRWFISDPYDVTIVHRVIIVLVVSVLVLAVLRRLLPAGIAWVLAVWWMVLPINFDTVYEVHLFAAIPTLLAVLVALHRRDLLMRATVFAILLVSAFFVRNELLSGALAWGAVWGGYEIYRLRKGGGRFASMLRWPSTKRKRIALGVALPAALLAVVLALVVYGNQGGQDSVGGSAAGPNKQELILCQNYGASAHQRGDFGEGLDTNRPLSCSALMEEKFGEPFPTWIEAIRANPGAMLEHFAWNASVIPQGIELMLFNRISGSQDVNPDIVPVPASAPIAMIGLVAVAILIDGGGDPPLA